MLTKVALRGFVQGRAFTLCAQPACVKFCTIQRVMIAGTEQALTNKEGLILMQISRDVRVSQ
jgi:hypothetical protein